MNAPRMAAVLAALSALSAPQAGAAQAVAWPADAVAEEGAALEAKIRGKVFRATDAKGLPWRIEYSRLGHLFVDVGAGFKDNGPYRVEGSQVCVTLQRSGAACSEYRVAGDTVYILRASKDEILRLEPQ